MTAQPVSPKTSKLSLSPTRSLKKSRREPSTNPLSRAQVVSAFKALKKYHRRHTRKVQKSRRRLFEKDDADTTDANDDSKKNFDDDAIISVQLSLKKIPRPAPHKGVCMRVSHSLWESADVLLIVKDNAIDIVKHDLSNHYNCSRKIPGCGLLKVMGVKEVMREHSTHERRRELLAMYDIFLCDDRLLPMMPRILGNAFFKRKGKLPRVVDLNAVDVTGEIGRVIGCVVGRWGTGTCVDLALGRTGWRVGWLVKNFIEVVDKAVPYFEGGWNGVLSANILCRELKGVALPVWNSLPETRDYGGLEKKEKEQKKEKSSKKKKKQKKEMEKESENSSGVGSEEDDDVGEDKKDEGHAGMDEADEDVEADEDEEEDEAVDLDKAMGEKARALVSED